MCDDVLLTVRLVRSFEHCNFRPLVFKHVSLQQTVAEFMTSVKQDIFRRSDLPAPFRNFEYDTMKIIHQAHGAKTNELVMSLEDDEELILPHGCSLRTCGVANETELAFFKMSDYEKFKIDPKTTW